MILLDKFTRTISKASFLNEHEVIENDRAVRLTIKLKVKNATGSVNFTDIMLQTGDKSTIWNSHPSEVRWAFNE